MQVYKAVVVKLDPTPEQEQQLASHIGAARFCYNKLLGYANEQYKSGEKIGLSGYDLRKLWNAHKDEWAPWWEENAAEAYGNAALNLGRAFKDFFSKKKGHPRFKKKSVNNSYTVASGSFGVVDSTHVKIPRVGNVHVLEPLGDIKVTSMTIRKKADGYYVSLRFKTEVQLKPKTNKAVGVDLGINALATLSTGEKVTMPDKLERLDRKNRRLARSVSRKEKDSANRERAKAKLARGQQKVVNLRMDTLHKLTNKLVSEFDVICIENLNVSGMMKNHHLARSVANASFYEFRRQLEYKTAWYGKKLVVADRWYPSSKTCSRCGAIHEMPLNQRTYRCQCGLVLDRDVNAALNLLKVAGDAPETQNACGENVRRGGGNTKTQISAKQESQFGKPHPATGEFGFLEE